MTRLRIRCRSPKQPEPSDFGFTILPGLENTEVLVIGDDGSERVLENVNAVAWSVTGDEPATATITFINVELDAEGLAAIVAIPSRADPQP